MKKNHQFPKDVLTCITNGIDTQAKIIAELDCCSSTLCVLLRKMIAASEIEAVRVGMHNVYSLRKVARYHDPFGLSGQHKSNRTFMLPPRRQHSLDDKRA